MYFWLPVCGGMDNFIAIDVESTFNKVSKGRYLLFSTTKYFYVG